MAAKPPTTPARATEPLNQTVLVSNRYQLTHTLSINKTAGFT